MTWRMLGIVLAAVVAGDRLPAQAPPDPSLQLVLDKVAAYVAGYGDKASLIVAVEKYSQTVTIGNTVSSPQPRRIVAEFAIVRAPDDSGWIGFRDVVEVDGKPLRDRQDRLQTLFTSRAVDSSEAGRIVNESARYNIGPIARNFNVPTATLFFFLPQHLPRFEFTRKGLAKVEGVQTWEIAFKETRSPTFIMKRSGEDVPVAGTLWVNPDDGTVVRTRMRMRNFADQITAPAQNAPVQRPQSDGTRPEGARPAAVFEMSIDRIDSSADVAVTYARHKESGLWLPKSMEELYEGPITLTRPPSVGRATTRASYSDFKQFQTGSRLVPPPQ